MSAVVEDRAVRVVRWRIDPGDSPDLPTSLEPDWTFRPVQMTARVAAGTVEAVMLEGPLVVGGVTKSDAWDGWSWMSLAGVLGVEQPRSWPPAGAPEVAVRLVAEALAAVPVRSDAAAEAATLAIARRAKAQGREIAYRRAAVLAADVGGGRLAADLSALANAAAGDDLPAGVRA